MIPDFIINDVMIEYGEAVATNGPFSSAHEGYAVLLEEMDELWDEVKKKQSERDPRKLYHEAKQIAAMGIRFMVDVGSLRKKE